MTVIAVLAALVVTGAAGAALGRRRVALRCGATVLGGAIAMGVTYGVGALIGAAGI